MKEYVERAAAVKYLKGRKAHFVDDVGKGWDAGIGAAIEAIENIPAADVVEVVRCKDCIWRGREECAMFYRCDCGEQHTWETDNDFCSYGERRDENA